MALTPRNGNGNAEPQLGTKHTGGSAELGLGAPSSEAFGAAEAVPPGYKLTEVGVIPEDWNSVLIGSNVEIKSGESPSLFHFESSGIPYFKVEQLNNNSKYLRDTEYFFQGNKKIPHGSLIFPKRGASILLNKIRILEQDSFMDTNLMTLTVGASIDNEYLYYALIHIELWRIADTTSIPQINNKHITPLAIAFPPTKAEQQAIAEALSDADALIESLEQLITKKRQIKQGAMQELLTGKRRLPGFSGEWANWTLRECLLANPDYGVNAPGVPQTGNLPTYLRITDIDDDGRFLPYNRVAVDHPFALNYLLSENELVFARTGASVGKTYLYDVTDGEVVFAGFLIRVKIDRFKIDPYFLKAFTKTQMYWNWVRVMSMRSGQPGINGNEYGSLTLRLPPTLEEQTAIATILSDMDTEITALETKLAKTRQLKQGMMQQLLTGRIRLL